MRDVRHNNANLNEWHLGSKPLLRKTYYYKLNRVVRHYNANLRKQYLPQKWLGWQRNARGGVGSSPPRTYNPRMNSLYRLPSRKAFHHLPNNLHSFNLLWYLIRGLSNLEFLVLSKTQFSHLSSWFPHRFESEDHTIPWFCPKLSFWHGALVLGGLAPRPSP